MRETCTRTVNINLIWPLTSCPDVGSLQLLTISLFEDASQKPFNLKLARDHTNVYKQGSSKENATFNRFQISQAKQTKREIDCMGDFNFDFGVIKEKLNMTGFKSVTTRFMRQYGRKFCLPGNLVHPKIVYKFHLIACKFTVWRTQKPKDRILWVDTGTQPKCWQSLWKFIISWKWTLENHNVALKIECENCLVYIFFRCLSSYYGLCLHYHHKETNKEMTQPEN